jgi:Zn-dependent protease with chaperone function
MKYTPKLPKEGINTPKENPLFTFLKLSFSFVLFIAVFYIITIFFINLSVKYLPDRYEAKIVNFIAKHNGVKYKQNKYLQSIADKMQKCTDIPYHVKIYTSESKKINAYALPSGKIVVTTGLLKKMDSENELAFVIGHELGHLKHRDNLKNMAQSLLFSLISSLMGEEYRKIFLSALSVTRLKCSRIQELKADIFGVDVVECAYGGVNEADKFFENLKDKDSWGYLLSNHPNFSQRVKEIKKHISQNSYNTKNKIIPLKTIK